MVRIFFIVHVHVSRGTRIGQPLASRSQPKSHMLTTWIWMRRRIIRRLIWIQLVWQYDNIFTNFEQHWSYL